MKCQYFGDAPDLFKWDVVQFLSQQLGLGITCVPMLTEPDSSSHGETQATTNHPGSENAPLAALLARRPNDKTARCILQIIPFFEPVGQFDLYRGDRHRHGKGPYFTAETRHEYFAQLPDELLKSRLIFLDPDAGFKVRLPGTPDDVKYLIRCELDDLYNRMTPDSVLMVIQFYWGVPPKQVWARLRALEEHLKTNRLGYIHNRSKVAFFFVTKQDATHATLCKSLQVYQRRYQFTTAWSDYEKNEKSKASQLVPISTA